MTDYEKQSLALLNTIQRAMIEIRDDLRWFKQRELNKAEAVRKMTSDVLAAVPRMPSGV
jgi:hypothetical protein